MLHNGNFTFLNAEPKDKQFGKCTYLKKLTLQPQREIK